MVVRLRLIFSPDNEVTQSSSAAAISSHAGIHGIEQLATQLGVVGGADCNGAVPVSALGSTTERAITAITGMAKNRNPSLNPAPTLEWRGLNALWPSSPRDVTIAMSMAVPRLPPRKKSIELILIAKASIWTRTIRDTVAAKGVFTSPNPAPSKPANVAMTHIDDPEEVESPSTAKSIKGAPTQVGRRAPTRSVRRPARIPKP